jgi:TRAP-type C4-dicarboxylate transport system permease large subunit
MPLATSIGMDPIHFGVKMVFNLMLGLLTPPVGMTLYIAMRFAEISLPEISRAVIPYLCLGIIVLILITIFPWFSLFLPSLFF